MSRRGDSRLQWVRGTWLTALLLLFAAGSGAVRGASVETLLMPGKVTQAHSKLEETCSNCHDRSNVRKQSALCRDCHKVIRSDIAEHHGYHGRMRAAGTSECVACHTEHKGRAADITQLNRAQFDHDQTEFPLRGAHAALGCEACHRGTAWRAASVACDSCHHAEDVHHGQFTAPCGDCHGMTTWTAAKFDHDRTHFPLTGAHLTVTCTACHLGPSYKSAPMGCLGCHQTDDVHRGARGGDCGKCHTTEQWKNARYDHLKETGYALLGVHAEVTCLGCHRSGNYKEPIPKDCNGCHRADDPHSGRLGVRCEDCHDNTRWQPVLYDHAARTHYELIGAHAALACETCHTAAVATQKLPTDCAGCHGAADPHAGQLQGGCANCHGQVAWKQDIRFDHDLSRFPLLGLHRLVSCAQCHTTMVFERAPTACVDCHAREDVHKGSLGPHCESCHSSNGWKLWTFDHARETGFALAGAHAHLQCVACHREAPGTTKLPEACIACHRKDDRHLGQYGGRCDQCHSSESWKGARIQ